MTAVVESAAPPIPRRRKRRRPRELAASDLWVALGCLVSAISACWLFFARLTEGSSFAYTEQLDGVNFLRHGK